MGDYVVYYILILQEGINLYNVTNMFTCATGN